jgi:hypothetical protein
MATIRGGPSKTVRFDAFSPTVFLRYIKQGFGNNMVSSQRADIHFIIEIVT